MVHWSLILVSSVINNYLCKLSTLLHVGFYCSVSCLIHPFTLVAYITNFIFPVVKDSKYIVTIPWHSDIYSTDFSIPPVCCLRTNPLCNISGLLKVKSDFTSSLNPLVIFQPSHVGKYWRSYWWVHIWSRILQITPVEPFIKSYIIYWSNPMYSSTLAHPQFPIINLSREWQS